MIYFKGHTYELVETRLTFAAATAAAEDDGGHLAIVESRAENDRIFDLASSSDDVDQSVAPDGGSHQYVWLGGTDSRVEGTWRWLDGREIADGFEAWGGKLGVQEPDNFPNSDPTGQDGLSIGIDGWRYGDPGQWNDVALSNRLFYVVEYDGLIGDDGGDRLKGTGRADLFEGRGGADTMTGGKGADTFRYLDVSDSSNNPAFVFDRIVDFKPGQDKIDLSAIDANEATGRDDAFRFRGDDGPGKKAGSLWYDIGVDGGTVVFADTDGDRFADFAVSISAVVVLTADDFLL